MKKRINYELLIKILQNIVLFSIAVLLVFGFYFHGYFYEFGLPLLIIIGGLFTFAIIKVIMWSVNNVNSKHNADGVLLFKDSEKDLIIHGLIKQTTQPARKSRMKIGEIYHAKMNIMSEKYFANLKITDILEKKMNSITREDIYREGLESKQEFEHQWKQKYGTWDPVQKVRLIRFSLAEY
ncbi:hypothetical protein KA005_70695 [bacterium]|nr:hypothetical protein [bacterium]